MTPVLLPMVFVAVMTLYALVVQLGEFYAAQNWLLLILDVIILIASLWVIVSAGRSIGQARKAGPEPEEVGAETAELGEHRD